jgi:hypothetical protein
MALTPGPPSMIVPEATAARQTKSYHGLSASPQRLSLDAQPSRKAGSTRTSSAASIRWEGCYACDRPLQHGVTPRQVRYYATANCVYTRLSLMRTGTPWLTVTST